jgi:sugar phosphate isomerase/epimerase
MAAGVSTLPLLNLGCAATQKPTENEVGVQLWSVRDLLDADFDQTIIDISEIGFDFVEGYGLDTNGIFPGLVTANHFERMVTETGMRIASCHASYFQAEDAPRILEIANRLGTDWVVIPWINEELREDYYKVAENLNAIGEQFKEAGVGFGYHNHDFEFFPTDDGEIPQEILMDNTEAGLVSFQADLYWFINAGVDPLAYIEKYPGRFCSYHIKDANEALDQTDIGTGIVDFESIFALNEKAGIQYVFVEDERVETPLSNVEIGYEFLKNIDQ